MLSVILPAYNEEKMIGAAAEVISGMHASVDCLCQQGGAAAKAAQAVLSLF